MEMIKHLSDEQLTDMLLEDDERALRGELPAVAQAARAATDFSDSFWNAQHAKIRARISSPAEKRSRFGALVWATAAVMLMVGALSLDQQHSATLRQATRTDSDQQLMIAVEDAVNHAGPAALAPAGLLASEINDAYLQSSASQESHKENGNDN